MKITKEDVIRVAHLARLDIEQKAIESYAEQIGKVLEYVDMLKQVNTDAVVPTSHVMDIPHPFRNDDLVKPLDSKSALANAPEKENGSFLVPRIIKG
jgi:aspartyl-tRNA(Asn)/glutamyl-tRNA(Gln) amidotransferase subunit C